MGIVLNVLIILIPFLLAVFWLWMFKDMLDNELILMNEKRIWTFGFIFLNIFAAIYYYLNFYRKN